MIYFINRGKKKEFSSKSLIDIVSVFLLESSLLKMRALLLALGGFILPFAAFYYLGAETINHIYLAFIFSISGLAFFVVGNIILGIFKPKVA